MYLLKFIPEIDLRTRLTGNFDTNVTILEFRIWNLDLKEREKLMDEA